MLVHVSEHRIPERLGTVISSVHFGTFQLSPTTMLSPPQQLN